MQPPIRDAVLASPDYPFNPVHAPVKLDQNESPEDFPAHLKDLVLARLKSTAWNRYPDLNAERLCRAIARHDNWDAAGIVVTTGSNVLIALLVQLTALDSRVVTVKPNFALYGLDAKLLGASLIEVPLNADSSINIDEIITAIGQAENPTSGPNGVIFIPRPHAPTGSLASLDALERLAQACTGWLLVIDEAYHQFAPNSAVDFARRFPHVVLLRTFSKAWGLAGVRLGYAMASAGIARQLQKLVPPFGISVLQTVCAEVALDNPGYMHDRVALTLAERERMLQALLRHPIWKTLPSSANFLLVRTLDAAGAYNSLLAKGVLVRRQDSYEGLQGCIRVTIGTRAENDAFLAAAGLPA
jgi:histidinol-phosphate aminotransferase